MIEQLRQRARQFTPRPGKGELPQAGVLMAITDCAEEPSLIYTLRGSHLSSHAGEVAFPGGKAEPGDADVTATALREACEEIGLPPERVEMLGHLDPMVSRWGVEVTASVGIVPAKVPLVPNPEEIDSIFQVPLSFLMCDERVRSDRVEHDGLLYYIPAWEHQGYTIWGLTAMMTLTLLNLAFDAGIDVSDAKGMASTHPYRQASGGGGK